LPFAQLPQGVLAGGAQRWQVDLHDVPEPVLADNSQITQFGRRFADPLKATLNRIVVFRSSWNATTSILAVQRRIACAFSTMSSTRRAGLSEGKGAVPVDFCLKTIVARRLFDDIHFAAQDPGQLPFKTIKTVKVAEAALREILAEADRHVDIVRGILSARYRAKQRHAQHPRRAEFAFVRFQGSYDRSRSMEPVLHSLRTKQHPHSPIFLYIFIRGCS
jgi:hypothetical protein